MLTQYCRVNNCLNKTENSQGAAECWFKLSAPSLDALFKTEVQSWLFTYHKLLFSRPKSKVYEITSWSPHNPDAGIKSKLKVDSLWNHNPDAGIKFDAVSSKYLPRQFYNLSPCLSQTSWSCQFCKLLSWKLESNCNAIACFTGISREYTSHVTTLQG